jgi:hypothetical protein
MARNDWERFLAFARNDKQNGGPVISNPFGILRVNSVRDLSELNHDRTVIRSFNGFFQMAARFP